MQSTSDNPAGIESKIDVMPYVEGINSSVMAMRFSDSTLNTQLLEAFADGGTFASEFERRVEAGASPDELQKKFIMFFETISIFANVDIDDMNDSNGIYRMPPEEFKKFIDAYADLISIDLELCIHDFGMPHVQKICTVVGKSFAGDALGAVLRLQALQGGLSGRTHREKNSFRDINGTHIGECLNTYSEYKAYLIDKIDPGFYPVLEKIGQEGGPEYAAVVSVLEHAILYGKDGAIAGKGVDEHFVNAIQAIREALAQVYVEGGEHQNMAIRRLLSKSNPILSADSEVDMNAVSKIGIVYNNIIFEEIKAKGKGVSLAAILNKCLPEFDQRILLTFFQNYYQHDNESVSRSAVRTVHLTYILVELFARIDLRINLLTNIESDVDSCIELALQQAEGHMSNFIESIEIYLGDAAAEECRQNKYQEISDMRQIVDSILPMTKLMCESLRIGMAPELLKIKKELLLKLVQEEVEAGGSHSLFGFMFVVSIMGSCCGDSDKPEDLALLQRLILMGLEYIADPLILVAIGESVSHDSDSYVAILENRLMDCDGALIDHVFKTIGFADFPAGQIGEYIPAPDFLLKAAKGTFGQRVSEIIYSKINEKLTSPDHKSFINICTFIGALINKNGVESVEKNLDSAIKSLFDGDKKFSEGVVGFLHIVSCVKDYGAKRKLYVRLLNVGNFSENDLAAIERLLDESQKKLFAEARISQTSAEPQRKKKITKAEHQSQLTEQNQRVFAAIQKLSDLSGTAAALPSHDIYAEISEIIDHRTIQLTEGQPPVKLTNGEVAGSPFCGADGLFKEAFISRDKSAEPAPQSLACKVTLVLREDSLPIYCRLSQEGTLTIRILQNGTDSGTIDRETCDAAHDIDVKVFDEIHFNILKALQEIYVRKHVVPTASEVTLVSPASSTIISSEDTNSPIRQMATRARKSDDRILIDASNADKHREETRAENERKTISNNRKRVKKILEPVAQSMLAGMPIDIDNLPEGLEECELFVARAVPGKRKEATQEIIYTPIDSNEAYLSLAVGEHSLEDLFIRKGRAHSRRLPYIRRISPVIQTEPDKTQTVVGELHRVFEADRRNLADQRYGTFIAHGGEGLDQKEGRGFAGFKFDDGEMVRALLHKMRGTVPTELLATFTREVREEVEDTRAQLAKQLLTSQEERERIYKLELAHHTEELAVQLERAEDVQSKRDTSSEDLFERGVTQIQTELSARYRHPRHKEPNQKLYDRAMRIVQGRAQKRISDFTAQCAELPARTKEIHTVNTDGEITAKTIELPQSNMPYRQTFSQGSFESLATIFAPATQTHHRAE